MTAAPPLIRFRDHTQQTIIRGVRMSHLSIEVGHFYINELGAGIDEIEARFAQVAPYVAAARAGAVTGDAKRARISTCFLLDDYFLSPADESRPLEVIEKVLAAAKKAGVRIDYLARESACDVADQQELAREVLDKVHPEPEPGANGAGPATRWPGWLSNGRFPERTSNQAMGRVGPREPEEYGARNHSVFLAVELYKQRFAGAAGLDDRLWSCSFLAAVWQLMRLGLLRDAGEDIVKPVDVDDIPARASSWSALPALIRLNQDAAPFSAYRTLSILPQDYLPIEHAVRQILAHVYIEPAILEQNRTRARSEGIALPKELVRRTTHIFLEGPDIAEER